MKYDLQVQLTITAAAALYAAYSGYDIQKELLITRTLCGLMVAANDGTT